MDPHVIGSGATPTSGPRARHEERDQATVPQQPTHSRASDLVTRGPEDQAAALEEEYGFGEAEPA